MRKALEYDPHNPALEEDLKKAHRRLMQANEQKILAEKQKAAQEAAAATKDAGKVFDQGGAKTPPPPLKLADRGKAQAGVESPPDLKKLRRYPQWQALEKKEQKSVQRVAQAEKKTEQVSQQVQAGTATSVDLYRAREEKTKAESELKSVKKEMESFRFSVDELPKPGAPAKLAGSKAEK